MLQYENIVKDINAVRSEGEVSRAESCMPYQANHKDIGLGLLTQRGNMSPAAVPHFPRVLRTLRDLSSFLRFCKENKLALARTRLCIALKRYILLR